MPFIYFSIQKIPRLLVASQDGYLYIYNLDPNEGGECMLLRQHRYVHIQLVPLSLKIKGMKSLWYRN